MKNIKNKLSNNCCVYTKIFSKGAILHIGKFIKNVLYNIGKYDIKG